MYSLFPLLQAEDIVQIFIDSADREEIKKACSWGIISGVTTNPSLIEKAAQRYAITDFRKYLYEIIRLVGSRAPANREGTVSLEVIADQHNGEDLSETLYREAMTLKETFKDCNNVVIKIPINPWREEGDDKYAGIKAVYRLSKDGIKTNVTLVHSASQALLAAEAGATYVSPFLGGIDDDLAKLANVKKEKFDYWPKEGRGYKGSHPAEDEATGMRSGVALVETIASCYASSGYPTKILAASLRHPRQVVEAAIAGAHLATIPFPVLEKMLDHSLTKGRMDAFTKAADAAPEYKKLFAKDAL